MSEFLDWSGSIDAWNAVLAIASVLVAWIVSRFARRGVRALLARLDGVPPALSRGIVSGTSAMVILLGVGVALAFLGAPLQPLIALVLIVGGIAVLVLRGIADNFSAGIVLQTRHPIQPGEHVVSGTVEGTVEALTSRAVVVRTYDGTVMHIPNQQFLNAAFGNASTFGASRSELEVRMPLAGAAAGTALSRLSAAAGRADGVRSEPAAQAPRAFAVGVEGERLTARVLVWHDPGAGRAVRSEVVRALAAELAGVDGVEIATKLPPRA